MNKGQIGSQTYDISWSGKTMVCAANNAICNAPMHQVLFGSNDRGAVTCTGKGRHKACDKARATYDNWFYRIFTLDHPCDPWW